jgi:hypothetical protein
MLKRERPAGTKRKIALNELQVEGWRQRRLGSDEDHPTSRASYKTRSKPTGLVMGGTGAGGPEQLFAWLSVG